MPYIKNPSTDPYFNLAAEEYYLKNINEDIITLWTNDASVIIGKNQNAYAELNLDYIREKEIKVVRRLTGGGAVFHDPGNINFTFIKTVEKSDKEINFEKFIIPVIEALANLGVRAELKGRNDIVIDGCKISGNAQCNYSADGIEKKLHHGTLLFDVNIADLSGSLNVDPEKIKSKNIKSVKSRVTNIKEHLPNPMTTREFFGYLESFLMKRSGKVMELSESDKEQITKLTKEKYMNDSYTFGAKMEYSFNNKKIFNFGCVEAMFGVKDNRIENCRLMGDFFESADIAGLEEMINGTLHSYEEIKKVLQIAEVQKYIGNAGKDDILSLFF